MMKQVDINWQYKPTVLNRITERAGIAYRYWQYLRSVFTERSERRRFLRRRSTLGGYPSNHTYHYYNDRLVPGREIYARYRKVVDCYPDNMTSLLDLSACRGFYVLDAVRRFGLDEAVGVDVDEEFIRYCNAVKTLTGSEQCRFYTATLADLHADCLASQRQYDTTLLLGSYHYFYWGSSQSDEAYRDHDRILRMLHDITGRRVIFSGRLDYERLSHHPQQVARHAPDRSTYTTEHFLAAASRYFTIEERGFLDRSPLLVLDKR